MLSISLDVSGFINIKRLVSNELSCGGKLSLRPVGTVVGIVAGSRYSPTTEANAARSSRRIRVFGGGARPLLLSRLLSLLLSAFAHIVVLAYAFLILVEA